MTSTMEKQTVEVEKKSYGKRAIILTSWASVATALFLIAIIGGAVYLNDIRSQCDLDETDEESDTQTLKYNIKEDNEEEEEDVYLDKKQKTQFFVKRNKDGAIILIADVDYAKKISATYIPEINQCLLSSGEDLDWYSDWNPPKETDTIPERTDENSKYFKADPDNKVTDMSLLPKNIRPFCEGKEIYWTTPSNADDVEDDDSPGTREKRGLRCGWSCYWTWWGGWRCSFRCVWTWGK